MESNKVQRRNESAKPTEPSQMSPAAALGWWLGIFNRIFSGTILDELSTSAYVQTLRNYSAAQIDRGCRECLRTCKFFPKPAEIIAGMEVPTEDYAPLVRGFLPEPELTEKERASVRRLIEQCKERLGSAPIMQPMPAPPPKMFAVTDDMHEKHDAQKRKMGA